MFYSEQRSPTGWSRQLTPEAPHGAGEGDGEQKVRSISGSAVHLRRVRKVPDHLVGAGIDEIALQLFYRPVSPCDAA